MRQPFFYYGDELSGRYACINGHLATANQRVSSLYLKLEQVFGIMGL